MQRDNIMVKASSMKWMIRPAIFIFCFLFSFNSYAAAFGQQEKLPPLKVDWPRFLAAQDLTSNRMPTRWTEGPFMGNGMLGTLMFQDGDQSVRWQVGRSDYFDHRLATGKFTTGFSLVDSSRLPIGYFTLNTVGKITGGSFRLDLWNAEATGTIQTDKGHIQWRTLVHSDRMLIYVEIKPSQGEKGAAWQWHPEAAYSTRVKELLTFKDAKYDLLPDLYVSNPPPELGRTASIDICVQPLLAGGQTTTAWKEIRDPTHVRRLYISVEHTFPETNSTEKASNAVQDATALSREELQQTHRDWWHRFYPKSFLSLSSPRYEQFYWLQIYKLASATRSGRALADCTGPWLQPTTWPGCWWNLNIQMTYSPTLVANHPELSAILMETLDKYSQNLVRNVPEPYRYDSAVIEGSTAPDLLRPLRDPRNHDTTIGNLTWALHNCYMHYRHTMDDQMLRQQLFPLLKRAINFYFHYLSKGEDGKLHLIKTYSPEYASAEDCNYDLALLRWGCQTLLEICTELNLHDPLDSKWREVLSRLADYPTDENGYMIGQGVPYDRSHRHWSHLLMIYPLYLVNIDQSETRELMKKSVAHWFSLQEQWAGFSYPAASSIAASLGDGNRALKHLDGLMRPGGAGRLQPNTMYYENGGPIIETPLGGARAIQDMLIQSWGNAIRVFPAVPDAWPDVEFHHFSAEGAFLVSAKREKGQTRWIRIQSLAGKPCRLLTDLTGDIQVAGVDPKQCQWIKPGLAEIELAQGQEILLHAAQIENKKKFP